MAKKTRRLTSSLPGCVMPASALVRDSCAHVRTHARCLDTSEPLEVKSHYIMAGALSRKLQISSDSAQPSIHPAERCHAVARGPCHGTGMLPSRDTDCNRVQSRGSGRRTRFPGLGRNSNCHIQRQSRRELRLGKAPRSMKGISGRS